MKKDIHPAQLLVMFMQRIYDKGLTTMSGGNLSVLDDEGNIWITPSGIDKGSLTPDDIVRVSPDGVCHGRHKPSCELPFHSGVYRLRPDVRAVLHAHPPVPVSFSVVRRLPMQDLICATMQGEMSMAGYDVPGSRALGEKVCRVFAKGQNIAMLENHGLCVVGADMFEAYRRFDLLNYSAVLELCARRLGTPQPVEACRSPRTLSLFDLPRAAGSPEAEQLLTIARRCERTGLFTSAQGSCSVRLPDDPDHFLLTPDDRDLALLETDDLYCLSAHDGYLGTFAQLHAAIYRAHPEIHAVITSQAPHLTAFAVTDTALNARTIPESYIQLRDVMHESAENYRSDPVRTAARFSPSRPAMLVSHEGAVTTGATLLQAFDRMEVMEATARSIIDAAPLGTIVHITDTEIDALTDAFDLPRDETQFQPEGRQTP